MVTRLVLAGLAVSVAAGALIRPRLRPRPRVASPRLEADALVAGDGLRLPLSRWSPKTKKPKALALGLHSYGDYREAFRLVGPRLADHGIELIAYDQRGFGGTASRGEWPGSEGLILDLAEAVDALRKASSGTPLLVIGESMGGSVALAGIGQGAVGEVDALVLAAPGVRGDLPMRQLHDLALRLGALALPWLAVELRRGARPWLDEDEALRLAEDPLILRKLSVGTYEGLVELATLASALPSRELPPTLLLHGGLDRTVPRAAIDELITRLAGGLSHKLYPERHHLLLHERGVDEIVRDCLEWLNETLLKRRKPAEAG
jgi:acylglycerol lipase